jgi:hypothetical protein
MSTADMNSMTQDELRTALRTLKDKEAKLEADLAIKECPDLEDAITPIVLALHKVKLCDRKLSEVTNVTWQKQVKEVNSQLQYFRNRVLACKQARDELLKSSEAPAIQADRQSHADNLRDLISESTERFGKAGISLQTIIPSLEDFD